jgi:putative peptidoglycan lipid II flippase
MKQSLMLVLLSAGNLCLTFVFQWYFVLRVGVGAESDALMAGMTIPQVVLGVVSSTLPYVLMPVFAQVADQDMKRMAWTIFWLVSLGLSCVTALLAVFTAFWVPLLVPGFSDVSLAQAIELSRILLWMQVLTSLTFVQSSIYQARNRFIWVEWTQLLSTLLALAALVWALPRYGVTACAWLMVVRAFLQLLLLMPGMGRLCVPSLKLQAVRQIGARIRPLILGWSYYKTELMLDRFLLSTSPAGSLSLFNLAQQIISAACQVIGKAWVIPLIPSFSNWYQQQGDDAMIQRFRRRLFGLVLINLLGMAVFAVCGQQILGCLVAFGRLSASSVHTLWWMLLGLTGVLIGGVGQQLCASLYYASGNTLTPTKISILVFTVYLPLKVWVFRLYGVMGLVWVFSGYSLVNFLAQALFLEYRRYYIEYRRAVVGEHGGL